MKWELKGADRTTGVDCRVVVDAEHEDEVRIFANRRGILVSEINPAHEMPVEHGAKAKKHPIERHAKSARTVALFLSILSWIFVIGALLVLGVAALGADEDRENFGGVIAALFVSAIGLAFASLLRLAASASLLLLKHVEGDGYEGSQ